MQICHWSFSRVLDGSKFYSNCKFTPSSASLILGISSQSIVQGPTSVVNPRITYSVVDKRIFGDTIYGSRTVNGDNISNRRFSISIGSGNDRSNLQMRFENKVDSPISQSPYIRWSGSGNLEY